MHASDAYGKQAAVAIKQRNGALGSHRLRVEAGPPDRLTAAALRADALHWAAANAEPRPATVQVWFGALKTIQALVHGDRNGDPNARVYVVVARGRFLGWAAHFPSPAAMPRGDTLTLVFNVSDLLLREWFLGNEPKDADITASMGPGTTL